MHMILSCKQICIEHGQPSSIYDDDFSIDEQKWHVAFFFGRRIGESIVDTTRHHLTSSQRQAATPLLFTQTKVGLFRNLFIRAR